MKKVITIAALMAFSLFAPSATCFAQAKPAAKATPAVKATTTTTATTTKAKVAAPTQTQCVCGKKVDATQHIDVSGKRVYACSKACLSTIAKNPAKAVKTLETKGQKLEVIPPPSKPLPTPVPPKSSTSK